MTPEERAKFCASLFLDQAKVSPEKRSRVEREIAVSIRVAVKAEQVACELIALRHRDLCKLLGTKGEVDAADNIAAAIRARTP